MVEVYNEFFVRKIGNNYLLTTRFGDWVILSQEEYDAFLKGEIDEKLKKKLEDNSILLTPSNIIKVLEKITKKFGYLYKVPLVNLQINLTYRCNLACRYCHASSSPQTEVEADKDVVKDIVRFAKKLPVKFISVEFQGGEPLLKFELIQDVLEGMRNISQKEVVNKVVITNGTLVDEDIAKFFSKTSTRVSCSLDGPEDMHNAHRIYPSGKGTYEDVERSVEILKRYGNEVTMTSTVSKKTLELGGAEALVKEYVKHGMPFIFYRPVMYMGRARDNYDELAMSAEEFFEFVRDCFNVVDTLTKSGVHIRDKTLEKYVNNILSPYRSYSCLRDICGGGLTHLVISPDRMIYPCDTLKRAEEMKIGSIKDSYQKLFLNAVWFTIIPQDLAPLCDSCPYIGFCGFCKSHNYWCAGSLLPYHFLMEECKFKMMLFDFLFSKIDYIKSNYGRLFRYETSKKQT